MKIKVYDDKDELIGIYSGDIAMMITGIDKGTHIESSVGYSGSYNQLTRLYLALGSHIHDGFVEELKEKGVIEDGEKKNSLSEET